MRRLKNSFMSHDMRRSSMWRCIFLISTLFFGCNEFCVGQPQWLNLPATPSLAKTNHSGYASINGAQIWYAEFGHGQPIILLHGGMANSDYWGNQIPVLAKHYKVIVMDSRGQGRSTNNGSPYSYDLMATDVIKLMDFLKIKKAAIVGWSDGAIVGLKIAVYYPERLTKLFAFAANSNPSGINPNVSRSSLTKIYFSRAEKEYKKLSIESKKYHSLLKQINKMWAVEPNFTKKQLNSIKTPTLIVDGDHDEAIKQEDTLFLAKNIPNAGLLLQPWVGHFSFLQDSKQFNNDVLHFLENTPIS